MKKYRTEIIVNVLSLLSGREDGSGSGGHSRQSGSSSPYDQRQPAGHDDAPADISDGRHTVLEEFEFPRRHQRLRERLECVVKSRLRSTFDTTRQNRDVILLPERLSCVGDGLGGLR